jgi:DNA-binding NtrC family response regulator
MEKNSCNILIVEDDEVACRCLSDAFQGLGRVTTAGSVEEFKTKMPEVPTPDVVILDAVFPSRPGSRAIFQANVVVDHLEELCSIRNEEWPAIILVSGQDESVQWFEKVTEWLEDGTIRDVLPKSAMNMGWKFFTLILQRKVARIQSEHINKHLVSSYKDAVASLRRCGIVTTDPDLAGRLWRQINQAAQLGRNVYIYGEKGTGKELIAQAISEVRGRARGYHALNCAEIPSNLFESEIYGHVGGIATDVIRNRAGAIETAGSGVLFLDEITKLAPDHAKKLLRTMEPKTRKYKKMGSDEILDVECMFVTAAQDPILRAVKDGFSAELADRITEIEIRLPPLRDRRGDIPVLANHFWEKYRGSTHLLLDEDLTRRLCKGQWPGNVRQLEKYLKRLADEAYDHTTDTITLQDAVRLIPPSPEEDLGSVSAEIATPSPTLSQDFDSSLSELIGRPDELEVRLRAELDYGKPPTWRELAKWPDDNASEEAILTILRPLLSDLGNERLLALQKQHRLVQRPTKPSTPDKIVLTNNPAKVNLYCAIAYLALRPNDSRTITKSRLEEITNLGQAQAGYVLRPLSGLQFDKENAAKSEGKTAEQTEEAGGNAGVDEKDCQFIRHNPEKKEGNKRVYELCEGLLR